MLVLEPAVRTRTARGDEASDGGRRAIEANAVPRYPVLTGGETPDAWAFRAEVSEGALLRRRPPKKCGRCAVSESKPNARAE